MNWLAATLTFAVAAAAAVLVMTPGDGVIAGPVQLELDTYRADDSTAEVTGPVLEAGQEYAVTVAGTFSYWPSDLWEDEGVCEGNAEAMPMFPSPGTSNGFVGHDAAWAFARPGGPFGGCGEDPIPDTSTPLDFSLDGGATFDDPPPHDQGSAPAANHTYHFTFTGQGHPLIVELGDEKTVDNYGIFKITVEPAATPTPTSSPSPTPTSEPLTQGDVDCRPPVNSVDALQLLLFVAHLPTNVDAGCPEINTLLAAFALVWGDVNCDGEVNSVDALLILLFVAHLPYTVPPGCPDIGEALT